MRNIFFIILAFCLFLVACKRDVDPENITLVGLWKRVSHVTITSSSSGPDTLYNDYNMTLIHGFSGDGSYVEYTYNEGLKDFYLSGTYEKDGDMLFIIMDSGESFAHSFIKDGAELWLELSRNSAQSEYYLLNKVGY